MLNIKFLRGMPLGLLIPCLLIAFVAISPVIHLTVRALGADENTWLWFLRWKTLEIVWRSMILAISVTIVCISIAVPISFLTNKTDIKFKQLWKISAILPLVIPSYIGAYLFVSVLGPKGILYQILNTLFNINSIPNLYGFAGSLIIISLLSYPYILLTLNATINNTDNSEEESARLLGLGNYNIFRKVTLPQLMPSILSGGLLVSLYTLSDFGAVSLLRYKTLTWAIFNQYSGSIDRNATALLALSLCVLAITFVYFESTFRTKRKQYRSSPGVAKRHKVHKLGIWQIPSIIFCGSIVFLSLIMPVSMLIFWIIRGLLHSETIPGMLEASINSLSLGFMTAILVIVLATPISYLSVRYPRFISILIEKICYAGFSLPSIAISIALVFIGSRIGSPLYQSLTLLVIACAILYMPTGIGPIKSSIELLSPKPEESSRTLGKGRFSTIFKITIPMLKSGIFMGAVIVFLVTMKELPAVLILSPLDFKTLSTMVWSYSTEAFFAEAAAPALLLILLSSLPLTLVLIKSSVYK